MLRRNPVMAATVAISLAIGIGANTAIFTVANALLFRAPSGIAEPDRDFYLAFNAWREPISFTIPPSPQGRPWRRIVDTALASPLDIVGLDEGPVVPVGSAYLVAPFSLIVLIAEG